MKSLERRIVYYVYSVISCNVFGRCWPAVYSVSHAHERCNKQPGFSMLQSASSNSKSSNDGVSKKSTQTVIPSHSRKRQKVTSQDPKRLSEIERLKELKTDVRLSEDGKSIKCLLCGKSSKLDKCKRSAEGQIKYILSSSTK